MNKYEEALECPNCVLGLNCNTCKKKKVLKEEIEKAQALDKALGLLKEKLVNASRDYMSRPRTNAHLKGQIDTYVDCITTIETELGRR